VHEIHRPDLIDRTGHNQRLRSLVHDPLVRLNAQVQLQLPVDTVDLLVVPAEALDVVQAQEAPKPQSRYAAVNRTNQSASACSPRSPWPGSDSRSRSTRRCGRRAGCSCVRTQPPIGLSPCVEMALPFFAIASFNRSALSCASTCIFFSHRFSSCSSLSWDISEASMPPNLLRHLSPRDFLRS